MDKFSDHLEYVFEKFLKNDESQIQKSRFDAIQQSVSEQNS